MTIGRAKTSLAAVRSTACCRLDVGSSILRNCLGKLSRETGQSRVPPPPPRITGTDPLDTTFLLNHHRQLELPTQILTGDIEFLLQSSHAAGSLGRRTKTMGDYGFGRKTATMKKAGKYASYRL